MLLTRHAVQRSRQRGLRHGDLELIRDFGTEALGGYLICRRDVERLRQLARRLVDCAPLTGQLRAAGLTTRTGLSL